MTKDRYVVPPMFETIKQILLVSLGYFSLALYFDNVCEANRGTSQPLLFFLSPSYWLSYLSQ